MMSQEGSHAMARPTKLTPEVQSRIISAIADGNHLETAAAAGGIAYSTYRIWILRGQFAIQTRSRKRADRPFMEFLEATTRAEHEAEAKLVANWSTAARTDWRAAESLLARRYPAHWARPRNVEIEWNDASVLRLAEIVQRHVKDPEAYRAFHGELLAWVQETGP